MSCYLAIFKTDLKRVYFSIRNDFEIAVKIKYKFCRILYLKFTKMC